MTAQTHRPGAPPSGPRGTTPLLTRYAALVAGRRTKWVVVVFWLLLIGVGGSLATKIGSVENNDAQTWLPANAESTHALSISDQHFTNMNLSTAVVVYARSGGLTGADLRTVAADRDRFTSEHIVAAAIPPPVVSGDQAA
jgi:putative drug exporter of the RND superfamily